MNSYILKTILFSTILLSSVVLQAQSVDDVIEKHIKAHGGQENWDKVESIKMSGAFTGFSVQKTFNSVHKKPNLYRSETGVGKFNVTLVYDGKQGWTMDPWFEVSFPRILNASEENVVLQKAEMCSPFLNYKQKGHKVELIGKEQEDGMDMFHLKLNRENGKEEHWFLDAKTYLEYKQTSVWDDFGYSTPQESYFDDFRTVEGIVIPFYIDRSFSIRNRVTEVESVEINPEIEASYFDFPMSANMHKLGYMKGKWSVEVKAQSRRGWYRSDSVTTVVEQNGNILQTAFTYENYFRYNKHYAWSFSTESQSFRMSVYSSLSSNMHVLEGEFINDTLSFTNSDINYKLNEEKVYRKFDIIAINENQFIIEQAQSQDKGKSWSVAEKLVFTRIE